DIDGGKVRGFKTVLKIVADVWKDKRKDLDELAEQNADSTTKALEGFARGVAIVDLNRDLVTAAVDEIKETVDPKYGGFGPPARDSKATTSPTPRGLLLLNYEARRAKSKDTAKELDGLVSLTLDHMALGGIYDQLGGGFHRYSTERTWTVPHFEKMP